jgi:hypothetical protein
LALSHDRQGKVDQRLDDALRLVEHSPPDGVIETHLTNQSEIPAATKGLATPRQDDDPGLTIGCDLVPDARQPRVELRIGSVAMFRAVQCEDAKRSPGFDLENVGHD